MLKDGDINMIGLLSTIIYIIHDMVSVFVIVTQKNYEMDSNEIMHKAS